MTSAKQPRRYGAHAGRLPDGSDDFDGWTLPELRDLIASTWHAFPPVVGDLVAHLTEVEAEPSIESTKLLRARAVTARIELLASMAAQDVRKYGEHHCDYWRMMQEAQDELVALIGPSEPRQEVATKAHVDAVVSPLDLRECHCDDCGHDFSGNVAEAALPIVCPFCFSEDIGWADNTGDDDEGGAP